MTKKRYVTNAEVACMAIAAMLRPHAIDKVEREYTMNLQSLLWLYNTAVSGLPKAQRKKLAKII